MVKTIARLIPNAICAAILIVFAMLMFDAVPRFQDNPGAFIIGIVFLVLAGGIIFGIVLALKYARKEGSCANS